MLHPEEQRENKTKIENERPCTNCGIRKFYARKFDIHFSGEDCPYYCKEYDNWKDNDEDV